MVARTKISTEEWRSIPVGAGQPLSVADVETLFGAWKVCAGVGPEAFFDLRPNRVIPRNWVGTVTFANKVFEVLPRGTSELDSSARAIVDQNISRMLDISLAGSTLDTGVSELASGGGRTSALVAAFYAQLVKARRSAVIRRYSVASASTRCPRGRISFPAQVFDAVRRPGYFASVWVQLGEDTPENRFLKAALRASLRFTWGDLRLQGDYLLNQFESVVDVDLPHHEWNRIRFDRLPSGYGDALGLGRMILGQDNFGFFAGTWTGASQIVFTPRLFESFFAVAFSRAARKRGFVVSRQVRGRYLGAWAGSGFRSRPAFELVPDIVAHAGKLSGEDIIVDTKWKQINCVAPQCGITANDAYQIITYMRGFNVDKAVLVYPWFSTAAPFDGDYITEIHLGHHGSIQRLLILCVSLIDERFSGLDTLVSRILTV